VGKGANCAKNGWTNLNIYVNMTYLCARRCLLGVMMIAPALKVLVALIFLIVINSFTH